ncbi:hypothetical protein MTO96_008038 [Rhipicephalus appendiculatus]
MAEIYDDDDDTGELDDPYDDTDFEYESSDTPRIGLAALVVFALAGVATYVMMGSTAAGKERARALQNVSQGTVATVTAATENRPHARRRAHEEVAKVTTTTTTAPTLETTSSTKTHAKPPTSTTTRDDVTSKPSVEAETAEDESVPHLREHNLPPRMKPPRTTEGTPEPEETTLSEAAEVQTPLMCTTGRMKTPPVLPEDGLCDYLIFTGVSISTRSSKKSANATVIERPAGNAATYKEFRKQAKEAKSTKYAVSLEGDFLVHGEKYVHMYPREIFVPFIDNNIKGFGMAYLNMDITTYLKHHQSRIEYTITRMDVVVKKLDKAAYSFFIIAALAPKREDRSTFANQLYDTVHEYPAVFVSHLTNAKAKPCRVLPSSFWKFEDTNNSYIASIKDALRMKRVINRHDVHHVVSLDGGRLLLHHHQEDGEEHRWLDQTAVRELPDAFDKRRLQRGQLYDWHEGKEGRHTLRLQNSRQNLENIRDRAVNIHKATAGVF